MIEVSWFSALCDDDYEFLGVPNPDLASSWEHCRDIALTADRNGFDNILLPSGYSLGIDSTAFAAGMAPHVEQINLLLAVRMGEMWLPQLARQLATIDQMLKGRLTINIISSDMPGEALESAPRYQRTLEWMQVLRQLLNGESIDFHGEFVNLELDPPRVGTVSRGLPAVLLRGFLPCCQRNSRCSRRCLPDMARQGRVGWRNHHRHGRTGRTPWPPAQVRPSQPCDRA